MSPLPSPADPSDGGPYDDDFDDATETVPCPECGSEVYEEAEQCPYCGAYIVHSSNVWAGRPTWWIVLGLLGILATILALVLH